jgi:hypothetical protein
MLFHLYMESHKMYSNCSISFAVLLYCAQATQVCPDVTVTR